MEHPVEVKVTVSEDITRTLARLNLARGRARKVWFLEDLTRRQATVPTPLLDAGIVLRLRSDGTDSTVKLRPCHVKNLVGRWIVDHPKNKHGFEYRIEGDWAGTRHSLAASAVAKPTQRVVKEVANGRRSPAEAFSRKQCRFLSDCTDADVRLRTLTVLSPINATRWAGWDGVKGFDGRGAEGVNIERWQVADLDFLEFSVRIPMGVDPVEKQEALTTGLTEWGVPTGGVQETKTRLVLEKLVQLHRRRDAALTAV